MNDEYAIQVQGVSKTFRLPREKNNSVKSALINVGRRKSYDNLEILKRISLDIKKGEFFGIVGRNGSGKSTLLKLLAGIYTPTEGNIVINGSLTPFIELGVGFNHELTGQENVYLNCSLLGFSRTEAKKMYKDIVDFAELGKFMNQKLKNYSSGMEVRLAFSIAIRAQTDILILDEVLAVGDEAFQQKCIDIFEKYKTKHQTVILVTHDMETIRRFCSRAALISNGKIVKIGDPNIVAREYSKLNFENTEKDVTDTNEKKSKSSTSIKLKITDRSNRPRTSFETFEEMKINISWPAHLNGVQNVGVAIHKNSGEYIFGDNTLSDKRKVTGHSVDYEVKLNLGAGKYHLVAGLFGKDERKIIDFEPYGPEFIIKSDPEDKIQGLVRLKSDWEL